MTSVPPPVPAHDDGPITEGELVLLRQLQPRYPNRDAALAEIARLSIELTRPKGTVHILSDVHGDAVKLRHVINNASGCLRPMVEKLFGGELAPGELKDLLALIFYPSETAAWLGLEDRDPNERLAWCRQQLELLLRLVHALAGEMSHTALVEQLPAEFRCLLLELLHAVGHGRGRETIAACLEHSVTHRQGVRLLRVVVHLVRDLAVDELILAGDCWDRGPRGDRVVQYLQRQPSLQFTWGNHDSAWLAACLGHHACIAHVLRISCRYHRLAQLEEGYGVALQPLEELARTVYGNDPVEHYTPRIAGSRDPLLVARMQKAAAIMQFKLEGQAIVRNPQFEMDHRRLLHRLDLSDGTVEIDGRRYALADTHFPTLDPAEPYALSEPEQGCLDHIRQTFLDSQSLWGQMQFLVARGWMYLIRDDHLIFHGCVPVDEQGEFQSLEVDGTSHSGRALFHALSRVFARSVHEPREADLDLLWYLWGGARSPLFGKDRICTFENDLVSDKSTHVETKNPYFQMIHEVPFCERVLAEFGVDPAQGLIVNGHVPVKIDEGESPLKRSGKAITIDGAFSSAYGDHGYTLVLEPRQTLLAKHHHFESVEAAVRDGVDIIPVVSVVRSWNQPRRVADTEQGDQLRQQIQLLERLVRAYRENRLRAIA